MSDIAKIWQCRMVGLKRFQVIQKYLFCLTEQTNERRFSSRSSRNIFLRISTYVTVTTAAHPCENNISAALRIPLCRLYGQTEVGYRVLVPGPDPTCACTLPPSLEHAINIPYNHHEAIAALVTDPLQN